MGITELLYNVWLLFYVMQFMSTAYLIQFVGSHYFRQFMSLSDYWILMQLNVLDTYIGYNVCSAVYVHCSFWWSMCTAVNVAIYVYQ